MSKTSFVDQALEILRHSSDGDDLDSRDLSLLQDVVNSAGDCLSEKGLVYWANLVDRVKSGAYVRRPFCGVPGMTRDAEGYVYWKGKSVEHFSFRDQDAEIAAARKLGAVCLAIEDRGQKVNSRSVMAMYDDIHFGEAIETPRWIFSWTLEKSGPRMMARSIESVSRESAAKEIAAHREACLRVWGSAAAPRSAEIFDRTGYDNVIEAMDSDRRWARGVFWHVYSSGEAQATLMAGLNAAIDLNTLAPAGSFEQQILGRFLALTTTLSEQNLGLEEAAMATDLPRERVAG